MKLREAIAAEQDLMVLDGTVEIDAAYVAGYRRPPNRQADRPDRRRRENQAPADRQVIMAVRERGPGGRVLATRVDAEDREHATDIVRRRVAPGATVMADESAAYDGIAEAHDLHRTVHAEAFQAEAGVHTNGVECVFLRVRRSAWGIHHRIAGVYLGWYVAQLAWHQTMREMDLVTQVSRLLEAAMRHPVSRNLCGYWQGNYPVDPVGWRLAGRR